MKKIALVLALIMVFASVLTACGEKESGVEAIEKDLIKARENDNEVQKPSLPFAPEEINPQNGNYTDEYPEAEGYMKNSKNKKKDSCREMEQL